ncbi:MAG: CopG family transcriptional regulator [Nitrospirae bacterium]|nr:MAG: CopG family transcriptional regulator [Nitrospirota bacterium]
MIRTQIQLTEGQAAQLKKVASLRHISMAELIRQSINITVKSENIVDMDERMKRAIAAAGRFRSGIKDLSEKHDKHLSEAFGK